jgi:hypothetical protein
LKAFALKETAVVQSIEHHLERFFVTIWFVGEHIILQERIVAIFHEHGGNRVARRALRERGSLEHLDKFLVVC